MVKLKCHAWDEFPVDKNLNLDILVSDFIGSEADKEGSRFICSILMFYNNCVADSR